MGAKMCLSKTTASETLLLEGQSQRQGSTVVQAAAVLLRREDEDEKQPALLACGLAGGSAQGWVVVRSQVLSQPHQLIAAGLV